MSTDGLQSGIITVSGKTSSTEYCTLAPTERTAKYRAARLHYVPSVATTLKYYGKKKVNRLTYNNDVPEIPISQVLVEFATADHFAQQRKWGEAAPFHRQNGQEILDTLTRDLDLEDKINMGLPDRRQSELGPNRGRGYGTIVINNG